MARTRFDNRNTDIAYKAKALGSVLVSALGNRLSGEHLYRKP